MSIRKLSVGLMIVLLGTALSAAHASILVCLTDVNGDVWTSWGVGSVQLLYGGSIVQLNSVNNPYSTNTMTVRLFAAEYRELCRQTNVSSLAGTDIWWQVNPAERPILKIEDGIRRGIQGHPESLRVRPLLSNPPLKK